MRRRIEERSGNIARQLRTALVLLLGVGGLMLGCDQSATPIQIVPPDGSVFAAWERHDRAQAAGGGAALGWVEARPGEYQISTARLGLVVPQDGSWRYVSPNRQSVVAIFTLPNQQHLAENRPIEETEAVLLVARYFESAANTDQSGFDTQEQLQRWRNEFDNPRTVDAQSAEVESGLFVSWIHLEGTFLGLRAGAAEVGVERMEDLGLYGRDIAVFASVIEGGPKGPLFVRAVGPIGLMREKAASIRGFVESARPLPARPDNWSPGLTAADSVAVDGLVFGVPGAWIEEQPSSSSRRAQFGLPVPGEALRTARRADGSPLRPGLAYISVLPGYQGSREETLQRWRQQVTRERNVDQRSFTVQGLRVTVLAMSGNFTPTMSRTELPDQRAIQAMIEGGPRGPVFVTAYGDLAVMQAYEAGILETIEGVALATDGAGASDERLTE